MWLPVGQFQKKVNTLVGELQLWSNLITNLGTRFEACNLTNA